MTLFLPKINEGCQGQLRTKRLPSLTQGWKSSYRSLLPVEGEIFFLTFPFIDLDIPLYRSGDVTTLRLFFAFLKVGERNGDITSVARRE
jgi:hypothetical protein